MGGDLLTRVFACFWIARRWPLATGRNRTIHQPVTGCRCARCVGLRLCCCPTALPLRLPRPPDCCLQFKMAASPSKVLKSTYLHSSQGKVLHNTQQFNKAAWLSYV